MILAQKIKYCIRWSKAWLIIAGWLLLLNVKALAQEPYMNEIKGTLVAAGSSFTVADEKFNSSSAWSLISQNISVDDILSFEINFDTTIYFYNQPFDCTVNTKIYIYGNQSDTSQITDSTTHASISLKVIYDTITGKPYKGIALYKFTGAYKYKVKLLSISSPQLSPIPAIFRLKGEIIVDRKYTFQDNSTDVTRYSVINTNQLKLEWTPSNYPGAEQFDLEYTHVDGASQIATSIRSYQGSGGYTVPTDSLDKWFTNNSTRITTTDAGYLLNIPYDSGFILFRIRGVQIHYPDGVRWESNWNYAARELSASCSTCPSGVVFFDAHEPNLNWQYTAAFAEEGKRKEVISYFDGTLRNRQSVTINNSDNKNIVQETIYDALGRPAVSVLPAPTDDSTIHYFRGFNNNSSGDPYNFSDLSYGSDCATTPDSITLASGAGKYYSGNNPFLNRYYYAGYIPSAEGYPFMAKEYMADNTGRLKAESGVGATFRLNAGHDTKYFYGKPQQPELDRLFGTEAGNASHYLKNMVIDPNGQISVTYINSFGKTVATALAGSAPVNMHSLPSTTGASTTMAADLMQPDDFVKNSENYSVAATATFLAPVTGTYLLNYRVDPLRMEKLYGPDKDSVICSNCYYDLDIIVKDNCNNTIREETRAAGTIFDTACSNPPGALQDTISVAINAVGEYYVTYRLVVSKQALDFYDSTHLVKNSDIKKLNYFLLDELRRTDFYGCYSNCETCMDALGTKEEFSQRFKIFYTADSLSFSSDDSLYILSLYDSLYAHCAAIQGECAVNVCDQTLDLLKMDVTPGGQYALYDSSNYTLSESSINVLAKRSQIAWFTDAFGNRDSVQLFNINGEDSIKLDVKDLSDSLFIVNWKDEWADSLVRLHPEYCHYLWCISNSNSYDFDRDIETWLDADTAMARGWFNPNVYDTILAHDPFFLPGGNGYALRNEMSDSLRLFSRTYARTSLPDKNILKFIDVILYCKNQGNGWDGCFPDSACRSRNREWFLYQQLYLNLKQAFYEKARRTSSNPIFANCVNCYIGKDVLASADMICTPAPASDFSLANSAIGENGLLTPGPVVLYKNQTEVVKHPLKVFVRRFNTYIGMPPFYDTVSSRIPAGNNYVILDEVNAEVEYVSIVGSTCDTNSYTPFTDSTTCNYGCPAGTYTPYDRNHISLFIQYGNTNTAPTGTPSGYSNCQFFSDYLLKTGTNSNCKFFNVWVCTYDSTCGGICSVASYPSYCPDNENASLYQNKIRRYPEYVNSNDFINGVLSSNPRQNSSTSSQDVASECHSNCEAQADIWINQLKRCTTDSTKLAQLKQALIDVCSAACSTDHPLGASSIPSGITATYHSFEEAIVGILGAGAVNDSCTAELLSDPYPYDKQPVYAQRTISETNYDICQQVRKYKTAYQASGFTGSFHSYLVKYLGSAYDLDSLELDDLLNSCSNCSGLLKDDIELPLAFEPNAPPCLLCDSIQSALTAFNAKFSGISTSNPNYEILFANFCNHRFGYSLTYDDYKTYLDSCTANSLYSVSLCNQPSTKEATVDNNGDDCMAELFATALTNASNIYLAYIDSVRRDFREAYMTRCLNVQPYLTMTATLWEYHYTLYYYDQSGNLVKTIPPEGIALLNDSALALVKLYRLLQNEGCYQYSDSIHFNNNGQINWTVADTFETRPFTAEMMLNLDSFSNQVLASKIREYAYSTDSGLIYRQAGIVIKVDSNKLAVNLYGIGADTVQRKAIAVSVLNVPAILSLNTWTHLVVQRTGDANIPVAIWVNGNPVTLQFTSNDIDSASTLAGDTTLLVATHNAAHLALPGKLKGTIKNLRIYNRLLAASEIRQNAYNPCQVPVSKDGLLFWSAMNNAAGNQVKDLISQQFGTLTGFTWQPFDGVFPPHRLPTTYTYNSLNEVLQQYSPDGDTAQFFYDRLGRLTASQNKEQKDTASYSGSAGRFSYTKYDALGRTIEVGEKSSPSTDIRSIDLLDTTALNNWLASGTNRQITKTFYDDPVNLNFQSSGTSRKRVVASVYLENASDTEGDSTLYSYDITGNVNTLVQHVKALVAVDATNGKKRIDYDYDLVSGKVNMVSYQAGKGDQFYYKYSYDADNRLTRAYSSRDKLIWNEDASYLYYLHGPLARTELGHLKVQGIDYAYTLQGWLKGINADTLNASLEMGNDGDSGTTFSRVSKDAFAFQLGYYNNDYKAIGGTDAQAFNKHVYQFPGSPDSTGNQLFNGNISYTTLALSKINNGATTGYSYGYDQLNRIVEMRQHTADSTWSNSNIIQAYKESIAYDENGNILKYLRHGAGNAGAPGGSDGGPLDMDSLTYQYNRDVNSNLVNNKLNQIRDQVSAGNYTVDIDDQSANNYKYDRIGNLIKDVASGLDTVRWSAYGKLNRIVNTARGMSINFGYSPSENRIWKQVNNHDTASDTYYIRDAVDNVIAVYTYSNVNPAVKWSEQNLFGSSRLGMWQWDTVVPAAPPIVQNNNPIYDSLLSGSRIFELTNRLGSVLATVNDKKVGFKLVSSSAVDFYLPEILSQNDYYPFGMLMPGRQYKAGINSYRFGFNGKMNDNEVKGLGRIQDYGMRTYDVLGPVFWSVDPLASKYPGWSPYVFAMDNPNAMIDIDGLEGFVATGMPIGNSNYGHGMILSPDDARKAAPAVAEYSKSAAHSFVGDVKSLGKLKTYSDGLDFFSLMFVPDVSSHIESNDQKRYETIQGGINTAKNIPNWGAKEWGSATGHLAFQFLLGKTIKFVGGFGEAVTGTWVGESTAGWSERAIAYQEHVTGVKAGTAFEVNGVKFDGVRGNTLLEAKSSYDFAINSKTGQFQTWFVNNIKKGAPKLLDQAQRQIAAAKGTPIEWHFSSEATMNATKSYFESQGLKSGITYKYNPIK